MSGTKNTSARVSRRSRRTAACSAAAPASGPVRRATCAVSPAVSITLISSGADTVEEANVGPSGGKVDGRG